MCGNKFNNYFIKIFFLNNNIIKAYSLPDGTIHGECSVSENGPAQGSLKSSSLLDFGNKQGVVCFVGQFSDNSIAVACLQNQVCQVIRLFI